MGLIESILLRECHLKILQTSRNLFVNFHSEHTSICEDARVSRFLPCEDAKARKIPISEFLWPRWLIPPGYFFVSDQILFILINNKISINRISNTSFQAVFNMLSRILRASSTPRCEVAENNCTVARSPSSVLTARNVLSTLRLRQLIRLAQQYMHVNAAFIAPLNH